MPKFKSCLIDIDEKLYHFLLEVAKERTDPKLCHRAVYKFVGSTVRQIPKGLDLRRLGSTSATLGPSLLVNALVATSLKKI